MKDEGRDDACRYGDNCAPSSVRKNPQGKKYQGRQQSYLERDPNHRLMPLSCVDRTTEPPPDTFPPQKVKPPVATRGLVHSPLHGS